MLVQYRPEGKPESALYAAVGEAPAKVEMLQGRPLVGPSGQLFDTCLARAGLSRASFYITNVFDREVQHLKGGVYADGEMLWTAKQGFTEAGSVYVERLKGELALCRANAFLALGGIALDALAGKSAVMTHRGSVYPCLIAPGKKVVGTIHPAASLRGQYLWRYHIQADMRRMAREARSPELPYPKVTIHEPSLENCLHYLKKLVTPPKAPVSWDIEVVGQQISRIGFAWTPRECISVPFDNRWSVEAEAELWKACARVIEDPEIDNIVQNGMFDIVFLAQNCGIVAQGRVLDTMTAHSLIYPDFPKGLGFLGSLYTDFPYWKNLVQHGDVGKEDG